MLRFRGWNRSERFSSPTPYFTNDFRVTCYSIVELHNIAYGRLKTVMWESQKQAEFMLDILPLWVLLYPVAPAAAIRTQSLVCLWQRQTGLSSFLNLISGMLWEGSWGCKTSIFVPRECGRTVCLLAFRILYLWFSCSVHFSAVFCINGNGIKKKLLPRVLHMVSGRFASHLLPDCLSCQLPLTLLAAIAIWLFCWAGSSNLGAGSLIRFQQLNSLVHLPWTTFKLNCFCVLYFFPPHSQPK